MASTPRSAKRLRSWLALLAAFTATLALGAAGASAGTIGANEDYAKFQEDHGAAVYAQMKDAGLGQNVISATWTGGDLGSADIGRIGGAISAANAKGIKIVITIYPAPGHATALAADESGFVDFAKQVVTQFKANVKDYIILNEPNRTQFQSPVSPSLTAKALADVYDAIHPMGVNVIGLGLSPRGTGDGRSLFPVQFLQQLGAAYKQMGRSAPLMDAISFHPYPFPVDKAPTLASQWPTIGMADLARLK